MGSRTFACHQCGDLQPCQQLQDVPREAAAPVATSKVKKSSSFLGKLESKVSSTIKSAEEMSTRLDAKASRAFDRAESAIGGAFKRQSTPPDKRAQGPPPSKEP